MDRYAFAVGDLQYIVTRTPEGARLSPGPGPYSHVTAAGLELLRLAELIQQAQERIAALGGTIRDIQAAAALTAPADFTAACNEARRVVMAGSGVTPQLRGEHSDD